MGASATAGDRSFHLRVFGCQMNVYDGELIRAAFLRRGWSETDDPERARLHLFHTCSVRENAEERVHGLLGELRRRKREDPSVVVAVVGCMADREGEELFDREPHVDVVCGSRWFPRLPDYVDRVLGGEERVCMLGDSAGPVDAPVRDLAGRDGGHSAHVAVMRGCDLNCTYCIVPSVRGRVESRPLDAIVAEVRALVDDGVTEVHLLGQTIDAYGRDRRGDDAPDLARLLDALAEVDGLLRLRLVTLHPSYVTRELAAAMARSPQFLRFLPVPLQSGSDRVLKRMKRGYNLDLYRRRIALLREAMPDLELVSDWIVGFPGETDEDFAASERAMEEFGFLQSYVFQYSPRPGTYAAERLADDVPAAVKKERNHRLLALQRSLAPARTRAWVGRRSAVLLEGPARDDDAWWLGRTHNGHWARLPFRPGFRAGLLREVRLTGWNRRELVAEEVRPEEPLPEAPSRRRAAPAADGGDGGLLLRTPSPGAGPAGPIPV